MFIDEAGDIYYVGNSQIGNIDRMVISGINDCVAFFGDGLSKPICGPAGDPDLGRLIGGTHCATCLVIPDDLAYVLDGGPFMEPKHSVC